MNRYGMIFLCCFVPCILCACATQPHMRATIVAEEELRREALRDIHVLQDFRAGKNSFVMSPERQVGRWNHKGFRYTLLDVEGAGSIRHIWTTRGGPGPYFVYEFYIDGEEEPSIAATDAELIRAAERFTTPVAPANSVPLQNNDFNLFLPIPFDSSCRIDVVQRYPSFWLWFCQIDYRLDDETMRGARLLGHRDEDGEFTFSYIGLPHQRRSESFSSLPHVTDVFEDLIIQPGELLRVFSLAGPGIARELRFAWQEDDDLRLLVRYDDAETYAVDSPVDRFFGPFRGASFYQHAPNVSSCYLPMPFRSRYEALIRNDGDSPARLSGFIQVEQVPAFSSSWGYFHALHQITERTNGHRPHQVLYTRGRGHWLGMTLYNTGHDHGGGDFAVIDGEGHSPAFLHGINGEDYFTFAWFGKGAHHPYAVAHSNEEGRYRHHFENVYPFQKSIAIEWGAFPDLSPESVAVWYQDSPESITLPDGAREESVEWDVFGPVPIPYDENGESIGDLFAVLPSVEDLDAGMEFECRAVDESYLSGWKTEWSVGPMLNLTYIGRHGMKIDPENQLGGMGHAMLARRFIHSDRDQTVDYLFSHDDPIELWVNGDRIYRGGAGFNGFENWRVSLPLRQGENEIVVKLTNYFNRNFNWAGFLLRPLDR